MIPPQRGCYSYSAWTWQQRQGGQYVRDFEINGNSDWQGAFIIHFLSQFHHCLLLLFDVWLKRHHKPRMGTAGAIRSLWTVAYTVWYIRQLGECWMYLEINFLWRFYVFCIAPVNTSKRASEAAASSWGILLFPAGYPKCVCKGVSAK